MNDRSPLFVFLSLLLASLALPGVIQGMEANAEVRIEKDVTYVEPDRAEKADLYLPPVFEEGKTYPGIVIVHGGGCESVWVR